MTYSIKPESKFEAFHSQVLNGGLEQWVNNGYAGEDDVEILLAEVREDSFPSPSAVQ